MPGALKRSKDGEQGSSGQTPQVKRVTFAEPIAKRESLSRAAKNPVSAVKDKSVDQAEHSSEERVDCAKSMLLLSRKSSLKESKAIKDSARDLCCAYRKAREQLLEIRGLIAGLSISSLQIYYNQDFLKNVALGEHSRLIDVYKKFEVLFPDDYVYSKHDFYKCWESFSQDVEMFRALSVVLETAGIEGRDRSRSSSSFRAL